MIIIKYKFNMIKFKDCNGVYNEIKRCTFLHYLMIKWDKLHKQTGVFRYLVDNLEERKVHNYLLQLNPERCTKRRMPECIDDISQKFDPSKFNFTKVSANEVLYNLTRNNDEDDLHSLLINISPISRYHSLLCPSINKCLPQVVTEESLQLVLDLMYLEPDRKLRIGFNSLCALASVNHLHYHIFIEKNILPVEVEECRQIKGPLFWLPYYPIPAFCFQVRVESLDTSVKDIFKLLKYFLRKSIAHNIFITRGKELKGEKEEVVRVLIWPRKSSSGVKQLAAFNVAVLELSGWFPVYNRQFFNNLEANDLEKEISKWKLDDFESICDELTFIY